MKLWGIAGTVGLFVLCLIATTLRAAGPRYALTQLHALSTAAGMYASAYDINDNGVAAGGEAYEDGFTWGKNKALTWPNGTSSAAALPNVAGYGSEAFAINNAGVVVGHSASTMVGPTPPSTRATVFRASGAALIPGQFLTAIDINDSGLVVGTGTGTSGYVPLAFNSTTNVEVSLNRNNAYWFAEAVNNAGTILATGGRTTPGPGRPARLSPTAAPTFLYSSTDSGEALDINEAGVAVGQFQGMPAIFSNGSAQKLNTPGDGMSFGEAMSINDRGRVIGWSYNYDNVYEAFVYESGVRSSLTARINGFNPTGRRLVPYAINNRGQIVGNMSFDHDNNSSTLAIRTAFRLDPIRTVGDTNHDSLVNFTDLLTLAQNYGKSGNGTVFWESGDFNYDWTVNFGDVLSLAQHYGSSAAFAADWALAESIVPEPIGPTVVLSGFTLLARRGARRVG